MEPSIESPPLRQSVAKASEAESKRKIKIDVDLETDRELRNGNASPALKK